MQIWQCPKCTSISVCILEAMPNQYMGECLHCDWLGPVRESEKEAELDFDIFSFGNRPRKDTLKSGLPKNKD